MIIPEQERRMNELQAILKEAADVYYNKDIEIMSNYEYDALYDELVELEKDTGVILPDSITQGVGSGVESTALPKVQHETPMLSLGKTKLRSELVSWLGNKVGCLSYKLDGSTVVLTYVDGQLVQAVTRGNGIIGEDITPQAKKFASVPLSIEFKGNLVVRGEALMTYDEFERINASQDEASKYKNPRNLASGTMRALDTSVLDERTVEFRPFTLVSAEGYSENSYAAQLDWLDGLGFNCVEHFIVDAENLEESIEQISKTISDYVYPSDGLVLFFDDVAYGNSLGATGHHPRNGIAFKWQDETAMTKLIDIIWQPSRTGRLNPVAVFEPVELEGTTVTRATLHNLTIMDEVLGQPYVGQEIVVYKANAIIPAVLSSTRIDVDDSTEHDFINIPDICPSCGSHVQHRDDNGSEFLFCSNDECPAKNENVFLHFVSRNALDIRGLSKETIKKLMEAGLVSSFADILNLADKKDEVINAVEGIKNKSFDNLARAITSARNTEAKRFLYALGIREIGRSTSRDICRVYRNDINAIIDDAVSGDTSTFELIEGVGPVMVDELCRYMTKNEQMVRDLLNMVNIVDRGNTEEEHDNGFVSGKVFVITGAVNVFKNRDEFKTYVESCGGKVSSSVSKKTDYLVTNDTSSGSSKNKKAVELGIPIISEEEFRMKAGR